MALHWLKVYFTKRTSSTTATAKENIKKRRIFFFDNIRYLNVVIWQKKNIVWIGLDLCGLEIPNTTYNPIAHREFLIMNFMGVGRKSLPTSSNELFVKYDKHYRHRYNAWGSLNNIENFKRKSAASWWRQQINKILKFTKNEYYEGTLLNLYDFWTWIFVQLFSLKR